eukprot:gene7856-13734_t
MKKQQLRIVFAVEYPGQSSHHFNIIHLEDSDPTSKLFANNANFNLPSLLQSQTRLKAPLKAPSQLKKDVSVEIAAPFTIMSYRPEKLDAVNKASLKTQQLTRTRKASKTFAGSNPRWKSKQPDLPNRASDYPDPLFKASKSFLARISELSQLELETVKLEKTKKLRKKKPADI